MFIFSSQLPLHNKIYLESANVTLPLKYLHNHNNVLMIE